METKIDVEAIQGIADGQEPPGHPLSSGSALTPEPITPRPQAATPEQGPIYLDAITLLSSFRGPKGRDETIKLPANLARVFKVNTIRIFPSGYMKIQKALGTNGTLLDRVTLGLPDPKIPASVMNQIHISEAGIWTRHHGSPVPFEQQLTDFWCALEEPHSFLEARVGQVFIDPQKIVRFELYREFPITKDESELHSDLRHHLGSKYGRPRILEEGRKGVLGDIQAYIVPDDGLKKLPSKRQHFGVKIYRKGDRMRVEVEFVNYPVPGFPAKGSGQTASIDNALRFLRDYVRVLSDFGRPLLDEVCTKLFVPATQVDIRVLQSKLEQDLRMKKVLSDCAIMSFCSDLATRGFYQPSLHPKEKRLSQNQMKKLRHPEYGILEKVNSEKGKKTNTPCYRLKTDWQASPKMPPNATPDSRAKLSAALERSLIRKLSLHSEVDRSAVRQAIEECLPVRVRR